MSNAKNSSISGHRAPGARNSVRPAATRVLLASTALVSLSFLTATGALAQVCSGPGQCVADGTNATVTSGTAIDTGTAAGNAGVTMYALNGGTIAAEGPVTLTAGGDLAHVVLAGTNGQITLIGGTITGNGSGYGAFAFGGSINLTNMTINTATASGAVARGAGSQLTIGQSTVNVGGIGLHAFDGAAIVATDVNVTSTNAWGVESNNSTVNLSTSSSPRNEVHTLADNGAGLLAQNAGTLTSTGDLVVTTAGANSYGAVARTGGFISLTGNGVATSSVTTGGTGAHGLYATGAGSRIDATRFTVTTSGGGAHGLIAEDGATVNATGLVVSTSGVGANGGLATGTGSVLNVYGGSYSTTGELSAGIAAVNGGQVLVDRSSGAGTVIHTTGSNAPGVLVDNATALVNGATINTEGDQTGTGQGSGGVLARAGGVASIIDTVITTSGFSGPGVEAAQAGSHIDMTRGSIMTTGSNATGAVANTGGETVLTDVAIQTHGEAARGVVSGDAGSRLTMTGGSILTTGNNIASAVQAVRGATTTISNVTAETRGANSYGLHAFGTGSTVVASGGSVTTLGAGSHAAFVSSGGILTATDTQFTTSGSGAGGLYVLGAAGDLNTATLTNVTLTTPQGASIAVNGGTANIAFNNSRALINNGTWLDVRNSATANVTVDPSQVMGVATTEAGSTSNVSLTGGSLWTMTGNSNVTSLVNDASTINYTAPTGDPTQLGSYKTLTAVNYTGIGGTLGLNTYLASDGAPSDRLVVDGGTGTGSSFLRIANAGGAGALTTGNGILVVDAINGGTTTAGAFALAGPVVAGPYEYTLYRSSVDASNSQAWYLRSTLLVDPPVEPPVVTPPTEIPNYRPEVSLYTAIPSMALTYGRSILGTLHDRVGDVPATAPAPVVEERTVWCKNPDKDFRCTIRVPVKGQPATQAGGLGWGRVIAQHGNQDGGPGGIYRNGPNYNYDLFAFQAGLDLYHGQNSDGSSDRAGIYGVVGQISGDVRHWNRTRAGTDTINAYTLGGYWTHYGATGWYLDGVAQGTWYDAKGESNRLPTLKSDGFGLALSLEGGYPIALGNGYILEPQAQIVYQTINLGSSTDTAALVRFSNVESLAGRLGARLVKGWTIEGSNGPTQVSTWLRANLWHEFLGDSKTQFSSETGYIPFRSDLGGTWAELQAGADVKLTSYASLFGNAGYQIGLDGRRHGYNGKLGLRVTW